VPVIDATRDCSRSVGDADRGGASVFESVDDREQKCSCISKIAVARGAARTKSKDAGNRFELHVALR
jgi:hypothetical protein